MAGPPAGATGPDLVRPGARRDLGRAAARRPARGAGRRPGGGAAHPRQRSARSPGRAGPGGGGRQGPGTGCGSPRGAGPQRRPHHRPGGDERHSLVVLRPPRGAGPGAASGHRGPWRPNPGPHSHRARTGLCGAPERWHLSAGRGEPRVWQPADPGRARRWRQPAPAAGGRLAGAWRLRGRDQPAHPARDLVQALGQHDHEPDFRPDRRHRRPHP